MSHTWRVGFLQHRFDDVTRLLKPVQWLHIALNTKTEFPRLWLPLQPHLGPFPQSHLFCSHTVVLSDVRRPCHFLPWVFPLCQSFHTYSPSPKISPSAPPGWLLLVIRISVWNLIQSRPSASFTSPDSSVTGSSHFYNCLFDYLPSTVRPQACESGDHTCQVCPRIENIHSR